MRNRIVWCIIVMALFFVGAEGYSRQVGQQKTIKVQFRVKWDGKIIPDISKVSGLRRVTEVVEHRGGTDANIIRYSPGISKYVPVILKRPRTHDKEFERWANKVWNLGSGFGTEVSLKDYRKDIIIEICDDTGKVLMAFKVYRCWPSEYIGLTDLDVEDDASAMEILILHHEGWERDYGVE